MIDDLFECVSMSETIFDGEFSEIKVRSKYDDYLDMVMDDENEEAKAEHAKRKASFMSI